MRTYVHIYAIPSLVGLVEREAPVVETKQAGFDILLIPLWGLGFRVWGTLMNFDNSVYLREWAWRRLFTIHLAPGRRGRA